jgi:hypothetical protein
MAIIKCTDCGNDVSSKARSCPKCGAPVLPPNLKPPVSAAPSAEPMSDASKIAIGIVAVLIALVLFAEHAPNATDKSAGNATSVPAVDLGKPVYTREGAVVCPASILADHRVGHDLKAATDAAVTILGKAKAVEAAGCELWRDGIELHVSKNSSLENTWVPAGDKRSLSLLPVLVFSSGLRN